MNHRTLALLGLLALATAPVARPRAEENDTPAKPAATGEGEKEKGGVPGAWKKATHAVDSAAHKGADAVVTGVKSGAKAVDGAAHKGADKVTGDEKK